MARYKVLVQSFINDAIAQEGEVVVIDDSAEVADNLELIVEPKEVKK